jgi:long-chain fatty acid transport protein
VAFAVLMCAPLPAAAQATVQFPVQFDFLAPGARSLALGGAFIAAADDATAAFTNPAGLAFIGRLEVSFEGRYRQVKTPYLAGGRVSGAITGRGPDTISTPVYARDTDSHFGPTYIALMFPVKARTTVTAYRHEVTAIDNAFFYSGAFQRSSFGGLTDDRGRDIPLGGTRSVRIANYGASAGYQIVEDKLAAGGGFSLYTFSLESRFARYGADLFGPVDTSIVSATATQDANDAAPGFNTGILWWPRRDLRFAATYRKGPRFTFQQDDRLLATGVEVVRSGQFKVPDVFGAGASWRAVNAEAGVLRLLADYDRVQYSQLKPDFINYQAIATKRESQLVIDDANEVHGGVEYRMLKWGKTAISRELVFRGGAWLDPDHSVRYIPNNPPDEVDPLLSAMLPGGSDVVHYTFGAGVEVTRWLNVSAAADLSSRAKYATISAEVIFPKK